MATVSTGTQTNTAEGLRLSHSGPRSSYPLIPPGNFGGRIKYADPKDLPSYPSLGLKKDDAAASAAASLGWANTKPVSLWTPDKNASAQKAASLANTTKMAASSHPGQNAPGSKTAAILAAGGAKRLDQRASIPASGWGNSAANQAFAAAGGGGGGSGGGIDRPSPREPMPTLDRQKSLRAAKDAMAGSGRPRSISSPLTYPDSANAASNALSAATIAHRPSVKHKADEAGASSITNMSRQMYTSNPPVKPEVDEKNREAVLHASALAMAKKMYTQQQKILDSAKQTENQAGQSRPGSAGTDGLQQQQQQQPMPFTNLQEAAYKLAQERLARLHEEHQKNREFADYYGTSPASPSTAGRRLTKFGGKLRRRASSETDAATVAQTGGGDDRNRSRQIRKQMSLFSTRVGEVDEAKRARDREALLAAAQRNVKARLEGIDEKMYREQGKVAPAKLSEWELKAHAAAQARSEARAGARTDQVDLGAGVYMDRDKVQEIAARRVQPVLDEINEKAQAEHLRVAALKAEQEKKRLESEAEKARNAEVKETARQLKEEEKIRSKQLKEEAKAREKEEKRLTKEDHAAAATAAVDVGDPSYDANEHPSEDKKSAEETTPSSSSQQQLQQHKHRLSRPFTPKIQTKGATTSSTTTTTTTTTSNGPRNEASPLSPVTSPESTNESAAGRVKNWLRSRLHKPRAKSVSVIKSGGKSTTTANHSDKTATAAAAGGRGGGGGFIGGHALTRFHHADGTGSMTSLSEGTRSASMREVALAGRPLSPPPLYFQQHHHRGAVGGDEPGEPSSGGGRRRSGGRVVSNPESVRTTNSSRSGGGGGGGDNSNTTTNFGTVDEKRDNYNNKNNDGDDVGDEDGDGEEVGGGGGGGPGDDGSSSWSTTRRGSRARTKKPAPLEIERAGAAGAGAGGGGMMAPPRALVDPARVTPRSSGSPNRDSKFIEIME